MRTVGVLLTATLLLAGCGGDDPVEPVVLSIVLSAPKQTIAVGEPVQLTAIARDVNGVTLPGATFAYSSSASSVVNVNANGRAIGIGPGTASITATTSGQSSTPLTITVTPSPTVGVVVLMPNTTFSPATATIKVDQVVVFDFPALAHTVVFDNRPGKPTDIPATMNATISREFTTAGTFPFRCTIHPGMTGQVVVTP